MRLPGHTLPIHSHSVQSLPDGSRQRVSPSRVCRIHLGSLVDLLHDSPGIRGRCSKSQVEAQIVVAHDCLVAPADGLLREFQLHNGDNAQHRSSSVGIEFEHKFPVLHLHGNVGGLLHECNQHPGGHQWPGDGPGDHRGVISDRL